MGAELSVHESAGLGMEDRVHSLIKATPKLLNAKDSAGNTPLHCAAERGHTGVVNLLLDLEADPSIVNDAGNAPVHAALQHPVSLKLLLSKGASINARGEEGYTVLHRAATLGLQDTVEMLVRAGASTNIHNAYGDTPLHISSRWGFERITRLLLDYGASANAVNHHDITPLHCAVIEGNLATARLLYSCGANPNHVDRHNATPMDYARDDSMVQFLSSVSQPARNKASQQAHAQAEYRAAYLAKAGNEPAEVEARLKQLLEVNNQTISALRDELKAERAARHQLELEMRKLSDQQYRTASELASLHRTRAA